MRDQSLNNDPSDQNIPDGPNQPGEAPKLSGGANAADAREGEPDEVDAIFGA